MKLWGNEIRGLDHKKLTIHKRPNTGETVVCAFAGRCSMQSAVTSWYMAGADVDKLPKAFDDDSSWSLLAIDRNGLVRLISSCPYPEHFDAPMAIGAGLDMALGAMHAGLTAKEAVELVNRHCNTSGGEIQVIDLDDLQAREIAA